MPTHHPHAKGTTMNEDYMQIPIGVPTPDPADLGPDRWGADEMATVRVALIITEWADQHPDLDAITGRDRGYILALTHALRAVRNDNRDNGEEGTNARYEAVRAIEAARDICASFSAWVDAGKPRRS